MAHRHDKWEDDDQFYSSGSHSDDSPILSHRYERRRFTAEREKRSTLTTLAKFFLFCFAMIMFCVLLYIPVYNKANYQVSKGTVVGWSVHTNRDTKVYVLPNNVTTIHDTKEVCTDIKKKLYLLIIVCSSVSHFDRRQAIRQTWGNYSNYTKAYEILNVTQEKYKNYDYSYDLFPQITDFDNYTSINGTEERRVRREDTSFKRIIPELAMILKNGVEVEETSVREEKRFEDDDSMLPEFDMNRELGEENGEYNDYNEESNVMKIPPRGEESQSQDLSKIFTMLKRSEIFKDYLETGNFLPDFKVVFLLGLPANANDTETHGKIEEEVNKYGDIIQEDFVDSYNNLTLKSVMMLKWVTNKCNDSVRYILKTDDDVYINVPILMSDLRSRSRDFDKKIAKKQKEYLLIGHLFTGAKPILDAKDKWFSPRYMFSGRIYPRYLSGTSYLVSAPTARALFGAALHTPLFHLEDIYITGMCPLRATPRQSPRDDPLFSHRARCSSCAAISHATCHEVTEQQMRGLMRAVMNAEVVDRCERKRLTQIRRDRMRPKLAPKMNKKKT